MQLFQTGTTARAGAALTMPGMLGPRIPITYGCPGRCALRVCARQLNCGFPSTITVQSTLWGPARARCARAGLHYIYIPYRKRSVTRPKNSFPPKKTLQRVPSRTNITTTDTQHTHKATPKLEMHPPGDLLDFN